MNYMFQWRDLSHKRKLDYARYSLPSLNEENLDETKGLQLLSSSLSAAEIIDLNELPRDRVHGWQPL